LFRRIWSHKDLVVSLVKIQYQLRYRQSFIGFAWALLPTLATLGTAVLVFHKVVGLNTGKVPYATFTMAALVPWTFFANSVSLAVTSVTGGLAAVTRLSFPRAVLPLSMVGLSLLDFVVSGFVFVAFAIITRVGLPLTALWFPALVLIEVILALGVSLLSSALNVFARDLRLAVPLTIQLWLFVTPVMYPLQTVPPSIRGYYLANPMTGLVESFRRVLVYGRAPSIGLLLPAIVGAAATFLIGYWYFAATESRFADVI